VESSYAGMQPKRWADCMIDNIENPVALISVRWLSAAEGGRRSGPPTAPVYAATCVFPLGGEEQTVPGWPASASQISILIQRLEPTPEDEELAKAGFLAPELAWPYLHVGAPILVMEGPKPVAHAVVRELFA
jgi:hypothetical protein